MARPRAVVVLGIIAIVLIGLNLRAGITGASALLHDLQEVLGYGPFIASVIPSIPTLCFAVAGAATSWLTRRLGVEKAILLALAMLAAGLLVRGIPVTGMLLAGTVVGMSGLAVCNVAMPSFIREHYADKTSLMTALYTVTMTTGATVTAVLVVPLAQGLGSASAGLGSIGLLSVAAFLGFLPVALHAHRNATPGRGATFPLAAPADPQGRAAHRHFHPAGAARVCRAELVPVHADHHGPHRDGQRPDVRADAAGLCSGRHGADRHRVPAPDAAAGLLPGQCLMVLGVAALMLLPASLAAVRPCCWASAWASSRWSW